MSSTLEQLCLKKICESIEKLSQLLMPISFSNLPWSTIEKIVKNYATYRWAYLIKQAEINIENDISITDLEEVEFAEEIRPEMRHLVISNSNWEDVFQYDVYCVWVNYYEIKQFNLRLCKSCYKFFSGILVEINKSILIVHKHYHFMVYAHNLHQLYQSKRFWCQNKFCELLFSLMERTECEESLHEVVNKKMRFVKDL